VFSQHQQHKRENKQFMDFIFQHDFDAAATMLETNPMLASTRFFRMKDESNHFVYHVSAIEWLLWSKDKSNIEKLLSAMTKPDNQQSYDALKMIKARFWSFNNSGVKFKKIKQKYSISDLDAKVDEYMESAMPTPYREQLVRIEKSVRRL